MLPGVHDSVSGSVIVRIAARRSVGDISLLVKNVAAKDVVCSACALVRRDKSLQALALAYEYAPITTTAMATILTPMLFFEIFELIRFMS